MTKKVVVGISGGVDSAVTAHLLREKGYDVYGVTMQISDEQSTVRGSNTVKSEIADAIRIAKQLGIPHCVVNLKEVFNDRVVKHFVDSYNSGRTPNPCLRCNPMVKWYALLAKAEEIGADYIATGHYANIVKLDNGRYTIANAKCSEKDQTYMLCRLSQEQLEKTLMPLGEYDKDAIRQIAKELDLFVADKKDSQDICFIPDGRYANFIWRYTGERAVPGKFITPEGEVIGDHKGIIFYTVGQRKGLKLNLQKKTFVKKIIAETNEVMVSDIDGIYSRELEADSLTFMAMEDINEPIKVNAKIRYSHIPAVCTIEKIGEDRIRCVFDSPQRAITPGQALVAYSDNGDVLFSAEIICCCD